MKNLISTNSRVRLQSKQITSKYRNMQEFTDKIFDTCSVISKVQNKQPEITKNEVQSAIKTLLAHKYYDLAGLKNEVFKSRSDSFLSSVTEMLNCKGINAKVKVQRKY